MVAGKSNKYMWSPNWLETNWLLHVDIAASTSKSSHTTM